MILDCVLTACNDNEMYSDFIPIFVKEWRRYFPEIDVKIIFISKEMPSKYEEYKDNIILFEPIEGVKESFISQYIRILYPSILNKKGVLITDIDMIPVQREYYTKNIEQFEDNSFVCYRNVLRNRKQIPICYNVASSDTWREVNGINNMEELIQRLKDVYSPINYSGILGRSGWFQDQLDLFKMVQKFYKTRYICLDDKDTCFKRLDRTQNLKIRNREKYTDFHMPRPYGKFEEEIYLNTVKIHFISYGDQKFEKSRERIEEEALSLDFFDTVQVYTEEVKRDKEFQSARENEYFRKVDDSIRGGGYYMWKPYIILKKLKEMKENDIIIYTDCGLSLCRDSKTKEKFSNYIEKVKKYNVLCFPERYIEKDWTKMEVFKYFGVENDKNFTYTVQYFGGVLHVIKVCDFSINIYQEWWNIIRENPNLVDDSLAMENFQGFKENRHDQSIWSILCKKHKIPEGDIRKNIPTNTKRKRY